MLTELMIEPNPSAGYQNFARKRKILIREYYKRIVSNYIPNFILKIKKNV